MQDNMPAAHLSRYADTQGSRVSYVPIKVCVSEVATINTTKPKEQAVSPYRKTCTFHK